MYWDSRWRKDDAGMRKVSRFAESVFFHLASLWKWKMIWRNHNHESVWQEPMLQQAAKCEYLRRGRPLQLARWTITEITRFMVQARQGEDIGAYRNMCEISPGRAAAPMPSWVVSMEQSAKRQKVEVGGLFRDFWHWVQAHIHRKHEFWITRHSTVYPLSYRSLGLTLEGPKLDLLYLKKFGAFCTIRFFLRFRILECYVADLYVQFFDFGFWILSFLGAEFGTSLWFYIR